MNIEKCVDEVRRGIEGYREYKYCDKFLDAMTKNAKAIVAGLGQRVKDLEEVKKVILDYVYCACTGLENAEGHPETIIYPRIAYTVEGVLAALDAKE
jgi:hypothetical protein